MLPFDSGLFGQANFGIVTKMGFWLYPQTESYRTGTITVPILVGGTVIALALAEKNR